MARPREFDEDRAGREDAALPGSLTSERSEPIDTVSMRGHKVLTP
jgi:hypothetical protein